MVIKGQEGETLGDRTVPYLDCISVDVLVVILHYRFASYYPCGETEERIRRSFSFIFYNCM